MERFTNIRSVGRAEVPGPAIGGVNPPAGAIASLNARAVPMESFVAELVDGTRRIKCLLNVYDAHVNVVRSWRGERHPWTGIEHPNLVHVLCSGRDHQSRRLYWAVALAPFGLRLEQLVGRFARAGAWPREEIALYLIAEAAAGLSELHRRKSHCLVLAPGSVYVGPNAEVRLAPGGPQQASYLAPERVRGTAAGAPADVFQLGIMLYELLERRHPTRAPESQYLEVLRQLVEGKIEPPRRARPQLAQLLWGMLALCPRDRPRAEEVRALLRGHYDEAQAKAQLLRAL